MSEYCQRFPVRFRFRFRQTLKVLETFKVWARENGKRETVLLSPN
jgi:hypothetical protein